MAEKYNWGVIGRTFIEAGHRSKVSLKVISQMFDVPYQSVRRRVAAEKWHNRRLYLWYEEKVISVVNTVRNFLYKLL